MKTEANGISTNYEISGSGKDLVLIHGAGDNLNMWYKQVPVFSKKYRVISYDVRGSGKSESPDMDYSFPLFAQDAYELMKALKVDNAFFLGYSMGGRIALELAINHPELVKALILANSVVGMAPPHPDNIKRRQAIVELLERGDIKAAAETQAMGAFSAGFKDRNPSEFDQYLKVKLQNSPRGFARIMRSLNAPSAPLVLSKVKCPVLIVVGQNDPYAGPEQGRLATKAIPGSKLVVLPTGHAAAIEAPDKFSSAILEFLAGIKG